MKSLTLEWSECGKNGYQQSVQREISRTPTLKSYDLVISLKVISSPCTSIKALCRYLKKGLPNNQSYDNWLHTWTLEVGHLRTSVTNTVSFGVTSVYQLPPRREKTGGRICMCRSCWRTVTGIFLRLKLPAAACETYSWMLSRKCWLSREMELELEMSALSEK
ncbi:hypothetical protein Tco_0584430 [Tanacetum coccineum]